jgi:hypothetical protein
MNRGGSIYLKSSIHERISSTAMHTHDIIPGSPAGMIAATSRPSRGAPIAPTTETIQAGLRAAGGLVVSKAYGTPPPPHGRRAGPAGSNGSAGGFPRGRP